MTLRLLATATLALAMAGCASMDDVSLPAIDHSPVAPAPRAAAPVATGGIYRPGVNEGLIGRIRRFEPGDVLTVLLNESTQAARAATANVSRASKNDVLPSGLMNRLVSPSSVLSGVNLNAANVESKGEGTADQSASLTGSITVTVMEVQPNGNMVVRGQKQMSLTQGSEVIQVSGIVRPEDVAPNNTVQSRRLADARFTYQGGGEIASATRAGWGTRAVLKFWPF